MSKLPFTYTLIRSDRKSVGIQIGGNGLVVRAPRRMSVKEIERIILHQREWIETRTEKYAEKQKAIEQIEQMTDEETNAIIKAAHRIIPERVAHYAPIVGVTYGRITLRFQKSRFGSCSTKGNLNFNMVLLLAPPEVLDSVVVHELCHRKEMNHSQKFYDEVLRVFPEYRKWDGWLKEHGSALMKRIPR